jgi:hypothetical protein
MAQSTMDTRFFDSHWGVSCNKNLYIASNLPSAEIKLMKMGEITGGHYSAKIRLASGQYGIGLKISVQRQSPEGGDADSSTEYKQHVYVLQEKRFTDFSLEDTEFPALRVDSGLLQNYNRRKERGYNKGQWFKKWCSSEVNTTFDGSSLTESPAAQVPGTPDVFGGKTTKQGTPSTCSTSSSAVGAFDFLFLILCDCVRRFIICT